VSPIRNRTFTGPSRGIERVSVALHRLIGAALGATGQALAGAGSTLRSTGQHLHKRVACL
jgi:hypothetical protein